MRRVLLCAGVERGGTGAALESVYQIRTRQRVAAGASHRPHLAVDLPFSALRRAASASFRHMLTPTIALRKGRKCHLATSMRRPNCSSYRSTQSAVLLSNRIARETRCQPPRAPSPIGTNNTQPNAIRVVLRRRRACYGCCYLLLASPPAPGARIASDSLPS